MFVIIGLVVVIGSILAGYVMHGGNIMVLVQVTEFIIIGGSGIGSVLIANPPATVAATLKAVIGLLKGNPYKKDTYMELLQMLYDMFIMARREGLVSLDQHVENPQDSKFFSSYAIFLCASSRAFVPRRHDEGRYYRLGREPRFKRIDGY